MAGCCRQGLQILSGVRDVAVAEYVDFRAREAAAVDDAGVVQLVGDDVVLGAENRRDGSGVGGESGLEDHARFHMS